jgi:hypothetical protein
MTSEPEARHMLAAAAGLLDQGQTIDRLARALTLAALIGLMAGLGIDLGPRLTAGLLLVTLAGLIEGYLAVRVGFDASLFHRLASEDKRGASDLRSLDAALLRLGLLPQAKAARSIEQRFATARRLFVLQGAALVLQLSFIFFGAAIAVLW